jgi:hypothetical protein
MLTKEHLKYRRRGDRVQPVLIDPDAPVFVELAAELLALYRSALDAGMRRGELAEPVEALIRGSCDPALAGAFNKLLLDGCKFTAARELDYGAMRRKLFTRSGELLKPPLDFDAYFAALAADPALAEFMRGDIYGDLPDNEQLTGWREFSPRELVCRYNLAQAQGLIMAAAVLKIQVSDPEPAALRRLAKQLKFYRLLGRFRPGAGEQELAIEISGPYALFDNTRKYAVQLAAFFPAVLHLKKWQLDAELQLGGRALRLKLDESSGLVSHYRHASGYVPEEIALFHRLFREKAPEWSIVAGTAFPADGEIVFPDFSFQHENGAAMHLELFHRWHRTELARRLELLAANPALPLLVGIDRALADDAEYAELERRFPSLAERLFRFRDFPGVDRVRALLKRQLG